MEEGDMMELGIQPESFLNNYRSTHELEESGTATPTTAKGCFNVVYGKIWLLLVVGLVVMAFLLGVICSPLVSSSVSAKSTQDNKSAVNHTDWDKSAVNHTDGDNKSTVNHTDGDNKSAVNHTDGDNKSTVNHADGDNKSAVNHADGDNKSAVNHADGDNKSAVNHADGDNKSAVNHADGDNKSDLNQELVRRLVNLGCRPTNITINVKNWHDGVYLRDEMIDKIFMPTHVIARRCQPNLSFCGDKEIGYSSSATGEAGEACLPVDIANKTETLVYNDKGFRKFEQVLVEVHKECKCT